MIAEKRGGVGGVEKQARLPSLYPFQTLLRSTASKTLASELKELLLVQSHHNVIGTKTALAHGLTYHGWKTEAYSSELVFFNQQLCPHPIQAGAETGQNLWREREREREI
jgi:hypothetical protein